MDGAKKIYIHKSHSKREMVELIAHYRINVGEPTQYNKKELQEIFIDKLLDMSDEDIKYDNKYFCNSIEDVVKYLITYNVRKILSVKEKESIMKISKRLNNYAKNDYDMDYTMYQNLYEIITDAQRIAKFGESPTIRKTIQLINLDPKININIRPYLTTADAIALEEEEKRLKKECNSGLIIRQSTKENPIIIRFD
tara:strand:- start:2782 stop:3369 length:588 start_codon:yes stop_codon:yes gene_type:complete